MPVMRAVGPGTGGEPSGLIPSMRAMTSPQAAVARRAEEPTTTDLLGSSAAGPAALRGSVLRSSAYALTILLSLVSAPLLIRHLGLAGQQTGPLAHLLASSPP